MKIARMPLVLWLVASLSPCPASMAVDFHVAPDGRDAWSGTLARPNADATDGPLASFTGARDAVRSWRAGNPPAEPVRVVFAAGTYPLPETIVLGPEDGGTAACPVSYEAAPGARVVFSGGRAITGWKRQADGRWQTKIPEAASGAWTFEQLWVDGRRAVRARTPNEFYHYVEGKVDRGLDPRTGKVEDLTGRAFRASSEDMAILEGIPPEQLSEVNLIVYQSWETARARIAAIDPGSGTVIITSPIPWGFASWGPNCRYHLENFRAALDAPGEWFLERDGTLHYLPLPGEDMDRVSAIAPAGPEEFLRFAGETKPGRAVEHVRLRGLVFEHGQYLLPPTGHADSQAEVTMPAAITLDGARSISIEDCEVRRLGIWGIWFRRGCRDCRVTRTLLDDLGAGGIKIGEGWGSDLSDPAVHTGGIVCDNDVIHSGGRLHHGAIGVWIGHSGDNQVTHCDISDLYYTGISVGWSWGYAPTLSKRNRIEYNRIHHLGWGVLSDMGGVYTLGLAEGTTVSHNVIHDVWSYDRYGRGGWGLYNDEGSTGIVLESNLVYRVKTGTYHQHYGRDNIVRNNILAFSRDGQLQRSRVEEHLSFTFERNLVFWRDGPLYAQGSWRDDKVVSRDNLYWNAAGNPVLFHESTLAEWQAKGKEPGSLVADPRFVDPERGDFRLGPDSPASKIGFVAFDPSEAGVYGDPKWVAIPKGFRFPEVKFAPEPPPPPPIEVHEDFELTPVGSRPADAQVHVEGKGDLIAVVEETAAAGKRSLEVRDAPGLQFGYNPHLVYLPNHSAGTTRESFALRIEAGTLLYHEWRSWNVDPYRVGPSFWIRGATLSVGEKALLDLPIGKWVHFEIEAKVGADANGKWTLGVGLPGEAPRRFVDLATGSADFKDLTWVGWSSSATDTTVFYLDELEISSSRTKKRARPTR